MLAHRSKVMPAHASTRTSSAPARALLHDNRLFQRQTWRKAVLTVWMIVRHTTWCAVFTPLCSYAYVAGSYVLEGSTLTVVLGICTSGFVVAALALVALMVLSLRKLHFVDAPSDVPPWSKCVRRLVKHAGWPVTCCGVAWLGAIAVLGTISERTLTHIKAQLYIGVVAVMLMANCLDIASKSIFQQESVEGSTVGHVNTARFGARLVRAINNTRMIYLVVLFAAGYVHVSVTLNPAFGPQTLLVFAIASFFVKVLLHHLMHHHLQRRSHARSLTAYFVLLPPAALVETQLRVALLRFQIAQANGTNSQRFVQMYVYGALAVFELGMRGLKLWLLWRSLRAPRQYTKTRLLRWSQVHIMPAGRRHSVTLEDIAAAGGSKEHALFLFGVASLADMYSEYVAIICSGCVYLVLHNNSQFALFGPVGIIEVAIDVVCCGFEIACGATLAPSTDARKVVRNYVLQCAFMNMFLCATGYIQPNRPP